MKDIPLRRWQESAIKKALNKYRSEHSHFTCVAAPGAGKTRFSATLALSLLQYDRIDFILCFAPSISVANGIKNTFSSVLNDPFDGHIGSKGQVITYQGLQYQYSELAYLIKNYRVLIVSDEIHHCAFGSKSASNQWGQIIDSLVNAGSPLTLSLSGTPWRSNFTKIALQTYTGEPEVLETDFIYGLGEAVADKVCRKPTLVLLDNQSINITDKNRTYSFNSIRHAIKSKKLKYMDLLLQKESLNQLLKQAHEQLCKTRKSHANAAGLAVASSVEQANRIAAYSGST